MDEKTTPPALALSVEQVTKTAGIGRSTVYSEMQAGRLRAVKVGRRTLVLSTELTRWLESLPPARS